MSGVTSSSLSNTYEITLSILSETEKAGNAITGGGFKLTDKIKNGKVYVGQGIIAGCAGGTYENIAEASEILKEGINGADFSMSIYPMSQPVFKCLADNGYISHRKSI